MLYNITQRYLDEIELELQRLEFWQLDQIDPAALLSREPFACDTMTLAQWLQFIFIPKMRHLILEKKPLPAAIAITPIAEHVWVDNTQTIHLISLLRALDDHLTD